MTVVFFYLVIGLVLYIPIHSFAMEECIRCQYELEEIYNISCSLSQVMSLFIFVWMILYPIVIVKSILIRK